MPRRSQHRITKRHVDRLQSGDKDYIAWDRDLAGFGVRVLRTGRKVYVAQARGPAGGVRAGSRRVSLGRHGEVSADQARAQALRAIRRIRRGDFPEPGESPESQPCAIPPSTGLTSAELQPAGLTLGGVVDRYREYLDANCRPKTVALQAGALENHIVPALGERPLAAIGPAEIAALHRRLRDTPGMANTVLDVLRRMFALADQWGLLAQPHPLPGQPQNQPGQDKRTAPRQRLAQRNPCQGIRKYRMRARQRYLTREEYRRLGRVLKDGEADGSLHAPAVAAMRLLILTGCRRDEILTLRWDDVDRTAGELRLRDTKTGPRLVSLTAAALRVLDGIQREADNPWVIVGVRPGTRRTTLKSAWRRVRQRAGLGGVRLHDLRHSYASRALAMGESLSMIGKLLNHRRLASTARYAHLRRGAERAAAARVGRSIGEYLGQGTATAMDGTPSSGRGESND